MYDHVVFISLDTLRSDCVASNPFKLWPAKYETDLSLDSSILDDLAGAGAFFPNCITAAPYTSASHATIFTGRWPRNHGVYELFNRRLTQPTVFSWAKQLGYRTTYKTDFAIMLGPYLGLNKDADRYIVEDDDAYLESFDPRARNFDFVHFASMHAPYGFHNLKYGGDDYRSKLADLEANLPATQSGSRDTLVETFRDAEDLQLMERYKAIVQGCYASGKYDELFTLYLEGVNYFLAGRFRRFTERLLSKLEGTNYLLVIFGDHGHEYDRDSYGHHNSISEGALRVPLIFFAPDIAAHRVDARVRTVDIVATVASRLNPDAKADDLEVDGESLTAGVWDSLMPDDRVAFTQVYTTELSAYVEYQRRLLQAGRKIGSLPHIRFKECVYDGSHRLVREFYTYTEDAGVYGMTELDPPREQLEEWVVDAYPVAVSNPSLTNKLASVLDDYNKLLPTGAGAEAEHSEEIHDQLSRLGYRV